ncbi:MAG: ATP-binding cassette domain-containing protein [Christensenellales bacterium]|nr:ATP-binding cassette domain-containing protein [Christensenellales bacterium]
MSEHILEVKNLCKYFYLGKNKPPMKAVDDVSFYIEKGETVGLVGESGCGKTTTGRTIIRLYQPTSGEIWFNGKRIDGKLNAEETRQVTSKMQMVFQDPVASLNPRMTVEEIICEGVKINKLYPDKTERRNQVYKMLDMVGLTREHATRYPHEFSGGQRQRICIARALIAQPDLLIADEPISALDVSIQAQILNILNDLRKELGLTILFIAHDLSVVKYFSNRVAVMNAGRIVEMSSSDEIYRDPQHAYTKSLLSAIPVPDPLVEKKRQRIHYDKASGVYQPEDNPLLREIKPGHFVLMSDNEWAAYQKANA